MIEVVALSFAFAFGMLVRQVALPPLVGFLVAGFALNAYGPAFGVPDHAGPVLEHVAHIGVLLLLFTVGLKLKLRHLLEPIVVGTALIHFTITVAVFTVGLHFLVGVDAGTAVLLAIALSFSSTVLAAKVLDAKRELRSLHGRTAIGILIIQDLVALVVLGFAAEQSPGYWALLVLGLPLLRPVMFRLLDAAGHEELLVLMGVVLAVAVGGAGFEAVGLSPEVGALVLGVLLSNHDRAKELSDALWGLKEIFLIGFFLQIGMAGLPDLDALAFALVFALILPLKGMLFFALLLVFRLRSRNAFLGSLTLTCYSEFGLIVTAAVLEEWLVPVAITVAVSFLIAAPLNRISQAIIDRLEGHLQRFERTSVHPDEQPLSLGDAEFLVIGAGRTGTAALNYLRDRSISVIGIDADLSRVAGLQEAGQNVVYADAEDIDFWEGVDISGIRAVILAMPYVEGKIAVIRQLRRRGFGGRIVAHAMFDDEADRLDEAGADETYLTMAGAGIGLAEKACEAFQHGTA